MDVICQVHCGMEGFRRKGKTWNCLASVGRDGGGSKGNGGEMSVKVQAEAKPWKSSSWRQWKKSNKTLDILEKCLWWPKGRTGNWAGVFVFFGFLKKLLCIYIAIIFTELSYSYNWVHNLHGQCVDVLHMWHQCSHSPDWVKTISTTQNCVSRLLSQQLYP